MLVRNGLQTITMKIDVFRWACISLTTIAAISSIISLPSNAINPTVSVVELSPNFTQSLSTGGEDHVQMGLWSYCIKTSSGWDPCDNISPCLAPNQSCSPRRFGYKLQVKNVNDTALEARTINMVASAVLHTSMVIVVPVPAVLQWLGRPNFYASLVAYLVSFAALVVDLNVMFVAQSAVNHAFNQNSTAQSRTVVYLDIVSLFAGISEWFAMAFVLGFPCCRGRIRWLRTPRSGERRYKWLHSRKAVDRITIYGPTKGPNFKVCVPSGPSDAHECSTCRAAGSNVFVLVDHQVLCISCCRVRKPSQFIHNAPAFCRVKTVNYKSE